MQIYSEAKMLFASNKVSWKITYKIFYCSENERSLFIVVVLVAIPRFETFKRNKKLADQLSGSVSYDTISCWNMFFNLPI